MKLIRFIKIFSQFSYQCFVGYMKSVPTLWTNLNAYFLVQHTLFKGKQAELRRKKYMTDTAALLAEDKHIYKD